METRAPRTILLTGAGGYIASAWLLAQEGTRVSITAVIRPGSARPITPSGVTLRIVEADLTDYDLAPLLEGVDVVLHLAAINHDTSKTEGDFESVNVQLTEKIAALCAARGVPLLTISTSALYVATDGSLLSEDAQTLDTTHPYPRSKREAEQVLARYGAEGLRFTVLRIGSVFGAAPRLFLRNINNYVHLIMRGQPVTIWRKGIEGFRPYTYIGDCVRALNFIIEGRHFSGEIYNVVTENRTTQSIIDTLSAEFPACTVTYVDNERMNDRSFGMDDRKIRALGFTPTGSVEAGIRELAAWFESSKA